jgi:hypothetical protein
LGCSRRKSDLKAKTASNGLKIKPSYPALIDINQQKEQFSISYIRAIAAVAGAAGSTVTMRTKIFLV